MTTEPTAGEEPNNGEDGSKPTSPYISYPPISHQMAVPHVVEEPEINHYGLALVFLAPALGGFLYGYDIGATSFVLAMLRETRDREVWWYGFSRLEQGLFVSAVAMGALLGSHIVLVYLSQTVGRRKEIRVSAALYVVGTMLNVMSGTIFATRKHWVGFSCLLMGRLTYGVGVGFIMHGAPTYMAEMSPSKVRGAIVSARETVIVFGIIIGMVMGDIMSDYPDNWPDLYSFCILGAVPMLLLTFKIPRSKRWLLMKGYREEAKESMQFVYKGDIENEFERMADAIGNICCRNDTDQVDDDLTDDTSVYSNTDGRKIVEKMESGEDNSESSSLIDGVQPSICSRRYRSIILIGMGLLISQQFSGQPSVLVYSRVLLEAAGWKGHASVITVLIMGLASSLTVALVDRLGRKLLLCAGCVIMSSALCAMAFGFWGWDEDDGVSLTGLKSHIVLWSMFVFIAGYQVGYGPVTFTVLSEIYPSEIRGSAMALSVEVNFLGKFFVQFMFPGILGRLGWGSTFILFAGLGALSFIFIMLTVPETKGLSLEEIQVLLRGLKRKSSDTRADVETSTANIVDNIQSTTIPLKNPLLHKTRSLSKNRSVSSAHGLTPIV